MGDLYATPEDVYRHALPRGAIVTAGVRVGAVELPDTIEAPGHGLETGSTFTVAADSGFATASGFTRGTVYYAIRLSDAHLKAAASLADAEAGTAIALSDAGDVGRYSLVASARGIILAEIEAVSRLVDRYLPHDVPLTAPIPVEVVGAVCKIVAGRVLHLLGLDMPTIQAEADRAFGELPKIARGLRLRDATATSITDYAISESLGDREETVIP